MIFKRIQPGETRVVSGFAFLPKFTNKIMVWFQPYKLRQYFDCNKKKWVNDYFMSI